MVVKSSVIVTFIAVCALCDLAFCDPMNYLETFTGSNANWRTDEDKNANLFLSTAAVSYDSGSQSVYAPYPAVVGTTKTTLIYADSTSSSPAGILAGSEDYSSIPSLSVWLKLSTNDVLPAVVFFIASNKNTGSDTLNTSTDIWYAFVGADPNYLGTSWSQYTHDLNPDNWSRLRGSGSEDFSAILADVDAIGVMMTDTGYTEYNLYVDNFTATPEPASLLLMGPMAGFLGLKVLRRKRPSARKVV